MRKSRFLLAPLAVVLALGAAPAAADEIEEALEFALEAYRAGDITMAKEEADFAAQLLAQKKAAALGDFLPEALPGWTRLDDDRGGQAGGFGGMTANTTYVREQEGNRDRVEVQLAANSQMVTAMAGMFANPALMGSMGEMRRIGRQKVLITKQNELQALVDNRIMVNISGPAPIEDKEAYFSAIDLRALEDF